MRDIENYEIVLSGEIGSPGEAVLLTFDWADAVGLPEKVVSLRLELPDGGAKPGRLVAVFEDTRQFEEVAFLALPPELVTTVAGYQVVNIIGLTATEIVFASQVALDLPDNYPVPAQRRPAPIFFAD